MADIDVTVITVQGEAEARRIAERAVLSLTAETDGPDRSPVVDAVTAAAAELTAALAADHDETAGPVVRWKSDRARVWSDRPWSQTGEQLPLVYHAAISVTAEFSDVEALSRFVEAASRAEHATVGAIGWNLTESTRLELEAQVRADAVRAAVAKAQQFAEAVGLRTVVPIAIADPGLLGNSGGESGGGFAPKARGVMMAMSSADAGPQFDFTPGEIVVSAAVDARFSAS